MTSVTPAKDQVYLTKGKTMPYYSIRPWEKDGRGEALIHNGDLLKIIRAAISSVKVLGFIGSLNNESKEIPYPHERYTSDAEIKDLISSNQAVPFTLLDEYLVKEDITEWEGARRGRFLQCIEVVRHPNTSTAVLKYRWYLKREPLFKHLDDTCEIPFADFHRYLTDGKIT